MQDYTLLNKRIELVKKDFGYSNEELGQICGVSYTAIGNIINGITKDPGVSLFINISNKLDINLDWLLCGVGEMYKNSKEIQKDHPEALKYIKQENENLRMIIDSKDEQIETLKKIVSILEEQSKTLRKQA